ncbi:hypothetical protein [Pseudomonas panipatensis]|uniref:Uncharacterized protein n=1 Tax=Pseudomonas panipatensis TaxID=428992 RepID=A0A1G8G995_9PSED|nr:hypothetical protein [Pseudomonas panipatensis]SDH90866.1 hypothetical protein SAMN05216272_10487 [Pseudomonas panipatensis]SMP44782.1 hypothetical protein SAMN06295951_101897 [Pseudomonas panipatensis]
MPQPMERPTPLSRRAPQRLCGALVIALLGATLALQAVDARAEATQDEATFLKESVAFFDQQTKTNLPVQVDKVTRLVSIHLDPDSKVLHYHYGVSSMTADGLGAAGLDKFRGDMRSQLERSTCAQPMLLQRISQHDIRIAHDYDGSDGKPLASVEIDPKVLQCPQG